ncbi:hypothetical protein ACHAPI_011425 [Fusarium lateritium]
MVSHPKYEVGDEQPDSSTYFLINKQRTGYPRQQELSRPWKNVPIPLVLDHNSVQVIVDLSQYKSAGAMPPGQGLGGH